MHVKYLSKATGNISFNIIAIFNNDIFNKMKIRVGSQRA